MALYNQTATVPHDGYDGTIVDALTTLDQDGCGTGYIVKGDTVPVALVLPQENSLLDANGYPVDPEDITGWILYIAFYSGNECNNVLDTIEVLPYGDPTNGLFAGSVTDDETFALPVGAVSVSIFTINNSNQKKIHDMATIQIAPCGSAQRDQ